MLGDLVYRPHRPAAPLFTGKPPRCPKCEALEREVLQLRAACQNLQDALVVADRRSVAR